MKDDKITYLTDVALITCIVTAGRGDTVIQAAQAMGAAGALVYHARGIGPRERLGLLVPYLRNLRQDDEEFKVQL
jgi:nitrogen regulatory protein P-II 1